MPYTSTRPGLDDWKYLVKELPTAIPLFILWGFVLLAGIDLAHFIVAGDPVWLDG